VTSLDGTWTVRRVSGLLPPMVGVKKHIVGAQGVTKIGPLPGIPFDVVGLELRYRRPLHDLVDALEPDQDGFRGRTIFRGRELGRFVLRPGRSRRIS